MNKKNYWLSFFFWIVISVFIIALTYSLLLRNSILYAIRAALKPVLILGFIFLAIEQAVESLTKHKKYLIKHKIKLILLSSLIIGSIFSPIWEAIPNILFPVVSSGLMEKTETDFKFLENEGQYRLPLDNKIVDVDLFYTSYDSEGRHFGRTTWVKGVDFFFKDKYIQSNHILNNAKGRHLIIYRYRVPFFSYYKHTRSSK